MIPGVQPMPKLPAEKLAIRFQVCIIVQDTLLCWELLKCTHVYKINTKLLIADHKNLYLCTLVDVGP